MSDARPRLDRAAVPALVTDLVCLGVFVALGRESHGYEKGVVWFLQVWWPLAVGLLVGGLLMRIWTDDTDWPGRLLAVIGITVIVGGPLRAIHGRDMYSVFTIVAFGMLCVLLYGWRLLRVAWRQSRGAARPESV